MKIMEERFDLVVAGAGPGGCTLAAKVAAAGFNVLVLESSEEPGRGRDWVVDVEKTVFDVADVPFPVHEAIREECESEVMLSPVAGHEITLLPAPIIPIRTGIYVRQLANCAREKGAEVRTGSMVSGPVIEAGTVKGVRYKDLNGSVKTVSASLVADCTGISGALRHHTPSDWALNEKVDPRDIVLARREVRKVDIGKATEEVEKGSIRDKVRTGIIAGLGTYSTQLYYLDLEKGYIDILAGIKPDPRLPTPDNWFKQKLEQWPFVEEKIFGDGGAIPIRRTWDSLVGDGFLVLGDCACQVIPAHGSGVASALIAADLASQTTVRSLSEGRCDRSTLWDYCHSFQSSRGALLAFFDVLRKHTDSVSPRDVDKMMKYGILSAEENYSAMVPELYKLGVSGALKKAIKGIPALRILAGFAGASIKANKLMKHYQAYPERYSEQALSSWISSLSDLY
jgi:digeranylgeranylglycerophospholipid reductase